MVKRIIRFVKKKELNKFLKIVSNNYTKNHILGRSKKVINFYYNFYDRSNTYLIGLFEKKKTY